MQHSAEYLTKFEVARVLGLRTMEINQQQTRTDCDKSAEAMAIRELLCGSLNYVIRRTSPGSVVDVPLNSLKLTPDTIGHLNHLVKIMDNKRVWRQERRS